MNDVAGGANDDGKRREKRDFSRRSVLKGAAVAGVAVPNVGLLADLVSAAPTRVSTENGQTGNLESEWITNNDVSIVGYTPDFSVLPGAAVRFKIRTNSTNYRIRIYRMGWYGGRGARRVGELTGSAITPLTQPPPDVDSATLLVDCGKWRTSATWTVPSTAVSGVYYAKFERLDSAGGSNYTLFVVRSSSAGDVLVQTSDATWHAYNKFGGASLYNGIWDPPFNGKRAYKVSYNRPLSDIIERESEFFGSEYPLIRWLERNGYDVNYCTQLDTHSDLALLKRHKVFISSGHDEYWTAEQRANVTAARDAKVNLIFFSGNEVFWKTRMEPSIDGTNTANRTLVCYKETLDSAKLDPTAKWTGTWRDPRFSPPADGGRPENELTGQLFRAINPPNAPDFAIEVPSDYSKLRFWRNTPVAALGTGQKVVLTDSTLGYEFDEVVDNGHQPAGLVKLSRTSATANEVLIDHGATYVTATLEHNMTMYRAKSGALVFGAGTVQWAYGLDAYHSTDPGVPEDPIVQQATVNLLGDMGAQPATLQSNLRIGNPSSDQLPPTSAITAPAAGHQFNMGTPATITGTAVDSGGVVGAVEVSTDGGQTWHFATGTSSWSYVFTPTVVGTLEVRVRATDDSYNTQTSITSRQYQVGQRLLPAPLFPDGLVPLSSATNDPDPVEVGVRLTPLVSGFLKAVRFYKGAGNTGTHVGTVWDASGRQLSRATFVNETASGWQTVPIPPVAVTAGTVYTVSVHMPNGRYAADPGFFVDDYELWPLRALSNAEAGGNGVFSYGTTPRFPDEPWGAANYWVDAVFDTAGNSAPSVVSTSPGASVDAVAATTKVQFTFSEAVTASSIVFTLKDAAQTPVAGTGSYDASTFVYTFTPTQPLAAQTLHHASVVTAKDISGMAMTAPHSWTFTTASAGTAGQVSLWTSADAPAAVDPASDAVELGTRFTPSEDGQITALRFYKASGSPGPHIGHLWDDTGASIATAVYSNETASGWQQVQLATPVKVFRNRSYVVSYYAPAGVYGYTSQYFGTANRTTGPLTAPRSTTSAGNGLFRYGASARPNESWQAASYWADVVFTGVGAQPAPAVSDVEPAPGDVAVATDRPVTAVFDIDVDPTKTVFVLKSPSGAVVAATLTYDAASRTAVLTPNSPLSPGTVYAASVTATSTSGTPMSAPHGWSFTTATPGGFTPTTIWTTAAVPAVAATNDTDPVELGVRFTCDRNGLATGIRFYKGPGNNGPHVGRLWAADKSLLGTASFPNETATGWQQGNFSAPVEIVAGRTYIASYHAPAGRYAIDENYFTNPVHNAPLHAPASTSSAGNGVFAYGGGGFPGESFKSSNYWVDVVVVDVAAPSVVATTPGEGAVDVAVNTTVSASFADEVRTQGLVAELRDGGGALVPGSVAYANRTVTFTPSSSLAAGVKYTAYVAASDLQGNAMASPKSWTFTTKGVTPAPTPISIWPATVTPAVQSSGESDPVELGVKFRSDVPGKVLGIRFWKGPGNTGVHVGNLWRANGSPLGSVVFGSETSTGWQTALFASPISIDANTTYVASYFLPNGNYPYDVGYFANNPTVNGPLRALANGAEGGNGLFVYGGSGGFPNETWGGSHYWVDVIFLAS